MLSDNERKQIKLLCLTVVAALVALALVFSWMSQQTPQ
jgi:hypothetical protein